MKIFFPENMRGCVTKYKKKFYIYSAVICPRFAPLAVSSQEVPFSAGCSHPYQEAAEALLAVLPLPDAERLEVPLLVGCFRLPAGCSHPYQEVAEA